jgi:nitrogen fixation/metabolism regulation signal transduction histidine kinase
MSVSPSADPNATGRHQRRLRNYLLDGHFQLKYTSYLVGTAITLSLALGALLWSVSRDVIAESRQTVKQGQETVQRGQEVVRESQKVSAVVHMNIVKDPVYGSNPELATVFNESAREQDERLKDQQQKLESDAMALQKRSQDLGRQQAYMFGVLITVLSLLVVGVGVAGIIVTHRVAGPIYKMKRLLGYVGDGHLMLTEKLRKGDELQHFFDAFEKMVNSLRRRQEGEIAQLDRAISGLEGQITDEQLTQLRALRREMQGALETSPTPSIMAARG